MNNFPRVPLLAKVAVLMSPLIACSTVGSTNLASTAGDGTPARFVAAHDEATQDVSSAADALATKASQELFKGNYVEASKSINQALQLRVDRSYYHLINGLAYHLQGKSGDRTAFDLAEQGYSQAIHFDPSNWLAYYFRGRLRLDLNQFDMAMSDLADALMFKPDDTEMLSALAYAAYRSGRPDIAAGALAHIEKSGKPVPNSVWRNSAMTMAALGDEQAANGYVDRYRQQGASEQDLSYLHQRLKDWDNLRESEGGIIPVQFPGMGGGASPYSGSLSSGMPGSATANSPFANLTQEDKKTASGTEDKMVVIDVMLISTEETIATNKGVNLLSGLGLEFGSLVNGTSAAGYSFLKTASNIPGESSTTITRAISIPSVSYTLNILNANNQRSEVLSRPTLIGLAGKQSDFFSGLELTAAAVAGGGSAGVGGISIGGGQAINIEKEIGVRLGVLPTILDDGRLKLAVSAERTFLETPSPDVNFTFKLETSKDQINANVIMRYGETLILGGLSEKETQYNRDGVPGLQDTPGLQYLFSNESKSDYQKSMLILLTPRPPQYVYQPEKAREAYEKSLSEDERPIANLTARYSDWFRPYPNWASIFHHLQENGLYREFRTGDVDLESWSSMQSLSDRLNQVLDFLHY